MCEIFLVERKDGMTALSQACIFGTEEQIKLLLLRKDIDVNCLTIDSGTDVNKNYGCTPLFYACAEPAHYEFYKMDNDLRYYNQEKKTRLRMVKLLLQTNIF